MAGTLFKEVKYQASSLVQFIDLGDIGLPDIQRPFVWKNVKVRDLFDSMYRGYPVGYLLFWQNAFTDAIRSIGTDGKQTAPRLLIVDGQQRLTSLFAVMKARRVVRSDYSEGKIEIAFNPLQETFEVADAAIRKDRSFIPDISAVWEEGLFELAEGYLSSLSESRDISVEEEKQVKRAITRLHALESFPFTALELSAEIDEEQVAEVFVRINSKGTPLNQADFILTLMSVFWDDGRKELEEFCRLSRTPSKGDPSPYNHYIEPDPDQLLRVSVGLGFRRARLRHVYSILRGKDLETEQFSSERRDEQFAVLKTAQERVLDLTYWHDFFRAVRQAGYLGGRQLTSNNNLIFSYLLYLMGRTEFGVGEHELRRAISRFFFMSNLTGRYTGSPESSMEFDLARLRGVTEADRFVSILDGICDATLTPDFWAITLPNDLATSASRSPTVFAYYASLVLLEARGLFSKQKAADLLDPSVHGTRSAAERHHLFPKAYLNSIGITEYRETNQIANYALLEWGDNSEAASLAPAEYLPQFTSRINKDELRSMYRWHALPDGWENMEYEDFLERRRELMAHVISEGFASLTDPHKELVPEPPTPEKLIGHGEGRSVEFKSTLRVNLHTGKPDDRMQLAVLKTIAGFLNGHGGSLLIGVADDGTPVGIEQDGFPNEDKMHLHLVNLFRDRVGVKHMMYIHPRFDDQKGTRVLVVDCAPARSPVFVKDGNTERFFLRTGASTSELTMSQAQDYMRQRFPGTGLG